MVRAIIVDLDGTLIDSIRAHALSFQEALANLGKVSSQEEIVDTTYEALLRLSRLRRKHGLIDAQEMKAAEERIRKAQQSMGEIDRILEIEEEAERRRRLLELKPKIDEVNFSKAHEEEELALPVGWDKFKPLWIA